jgi:NADH:ubiquinone oxidoreductase subunit E
VAKGDCGDSIGLWGTADDLHVFPDCSSAQLMFSVHAGETTADREVTFRAVECLGGCGYATVVAVDHRYRHGVTPEDVPAIVKELHA